MKKVNRHSRSGRAINIALLSLFMMMCTSIYAKSNPMLPGVRAKAFARARSLDNGISISWLEQTWSKNILTENALKPSDYQLMKKLGFKSIRLPVAFTHFEQGNVPDEQVFNIIDHVWKQCKRYGFKLIIDYHYGNLKDDNFLTETPKIINLWEKLTKRYIKESADGLFFEIYNEPAAMSQKVWQDAAYNIVTAIRKVDKQRTLLVGASNYNSVYELSNFVRLADENIIYVFHFYEPFFFTHQGAEWVGDQVATTGVSFPYSEKNFPSLNTKTRGTWGETNYYKYPKDGTEQAVRDKLQIAKHWSVKYVVPIVCGEYGVYNKYADLNSRCNYITVMRKSLKALGIPGLLWDYNGTFSIFDGKPALENLPECMHKAITVVGKK